MITMSIKIKLLFPTKPTKMSNVDTNKHFEVGTYKAHKDNENLEFYLR